MQSFIGLILDATQYILSTNRKPIMSALYQFSNLELTAIRDKLQANQKFENLAASAESAKLINLINTILTARHK